MDHKTPSFQHNNNKKKKKSVMIMHDYGILDILNAEVLSCSLNSKALH